MERKAKNLRTAPAEGQPAVEISLEELLEEIEKDLIILPDLEADDLTRAVIAKRMGVSMKTALNQLERLTELGKLEKSYKRNAAGHAVAVYQLKAGT